MDSEPDKTSNDSDVEIRKLSSSSSELDLPDPENPMKKVFAKKEKPSPKKFKKKAVIKGFLCKFMSFKT